MKSENSNQCKNFALPVRASRSCSFSFDAWRVAKTWQHAAGNRMANALHGSILCSLQARTNTPADRSASCRRAGHPTRPVVALAYGQHRLPSPNSYVLLPPFRTADCAAQVRPCRASPRLCVCVRERRKRGQLDKTLLLGP